MNAYELADAIDKYLDSILEEAIHPIEEVLDQSINMLRHQADYIKHLEEGLESSLAMNKAQAERQEK